MGKGKDSLPEKSPSEEIFDKLYTKFEQDVQDIIRRETQTKRLVESGQPRVSIRGIAGSLIKTAELQLEPSLQVRLIHQIATDLFSAKEYDLALEFFEQSLVKCDSIGGQLLSCKDRAEALQAVVRSCYSSISKLKFAALAPMTVSKLVICLQQLRQSLEGIFELPICNQEDLAWEVLNGCKLILEVGQPLIWNNCGRYAAETFVYASLCMESVINLCTVRHLRFRVKLYASVFYATITQGTTDEATAIVDHATKQVAELKEREFADPPVPEETVKVVMQAELDLAIMRVVVSFWRDPDALDLSPTSLEKFFKVAPESAAIFTRSFPDLCLCECIRVHLLTNGNVNEPFRKRSTTIFKAAMKLLEGYKANSAVNADADTEVAAASVPYLEKWSFQSLNELATLAVFEEVEGVPVKELLDKAWSLAKELQVHHRLHPELSCDRDALDSLLLLEHTTLLCSKETPSEARHEVITAFLQQLNAALYLSAPYRHHAQITNVCIRVWRKFLYPMLQDLLSLPLDDHSRPMIAAITPLLLQCVRGLDLNLIEDPLLVGTMAIMTAQLLHLEGEYRQSISLLRAAIAQIDEYRSMRVDAALHVPEDFRDIYALQHASIATRPESSDWFHSVKRLGAHAFAGCGIYGSGSQTDRTDQAVAEVHADLVALYFRYELQYCLHEKAIKRAFKDRKHKLEQQRQKEIEMQAKGGTMGAKKAATKTIGKTAHVDATTTVHFAATAVIEDAATLAESAGLQGINADSLIIVAFLKAFCAKNSYYKALLQLELAQIDTDEERRLEYLLEAHRCLEECEGREELLRESLENLMVMTDATRAYPVILGRSSRYIYAVPVGQRKLAKAHYYRVLAKEKGSGTEVSMYNDDFAGCERKIYAADMFNLQKTMVRIGPLRAGELYMLGSVAYTIDDKTTGAVSPSTPVIEAVNPLSTVYLWSLLASVASKWSISLDFCKESAQRVCNRYFIKTPQLAVSTIGRGLNTNLFSDPSLCMLALQQTTALGTQQFVESVLHYERSAKRFFPENTSTFWNMRKSQQLSLITSLHRVALVTSVACGIQQQDLITQCVQYGYDQLSELLQFDSIHFAFYLQTPLTAFIAALQSIPKRNWLLLEHKFYARLLCALMRVASLNRNISPMISLLNSFYPEAADKDKQVATAAQAPVDAVNDYIALYTTVKELISHAHLGAMVSQFQQLYPALSLDAYNQKEVKDIGYFWSMPWSQRHLRIQDVAVDFIQPPVAAPGDKSGAAAAGAADRAQLEQWVQVDKPALMSDYLQVMVCFAREAISKGRGDVVGKLFGRMPLCKEYLCEEVKEAAVRWNLPLLQSITSMPRPASGRAPAAAAAKKPPAKGAKEEPSVSIEDPTKIPDRFLNISDGEKRLQLHYFAELCYQWAVGSFADASKPNYFPQSTAGPNMPLDPKAVDVNALGIPLPAAPAPATDTSSAAAGDKPPSPRPADAAGIPEKLTAELFVVTIGAAVDMLQVAQCANAALYAAGKLWECIVANWWDPVAFCTQHSGILWSSVLESIAKAIDLLRFSSSLDGALAASGHVAGAVNAREAKECMLTVRSIVAFLLKVAWLQQDYQQVVSVGNRLVSSYCTNCPELTKPLGDAALPLIADGQRKLIAQAESVHDEKKSDLAHFITQYEEAQKRKRKKKLRIAKEGKDEEELLFDAECALYQEKIDAAQAVLTQRLSEMVAVTALQQTFDSLSSTGGLMLEKVRQNRVAFQRELVAAHGERVDYRALLASEEVRSKLDAVLAQYSKVANYLRNEKEKTLLVEALREQGDLLLLFGQMTAVKQTWQDAIDGLFNHMDACQHWHEVCESARATVDGELLLSVYPAVAILGKLSKYCAHSDWDAKEQYCRMAAELILLPFQESYGHPQTIKGFGAYICHDLGGLQAVMLNERSAAPKGLVLALEEVVSVLMYTKQYLSCLPVLVLWEHFAASYLQNPSAWLQARCKRIAVLLELHHFAEAVSMIAGIKASIEGIHNRSLPSVTRKPQAKESAQLDHYESAVNGLVFQQYAAFLNHLPPDDEKNVKALDWIKAFPAEFDTFAAAFQVALPEPVLSPEEKAAEEERKRREQEAADEAAKKSKGKAPPKKDEAAAAPVAPRTTPLFSAFQVTEVQFLCATLLLKISMLDSKTTVKASLMLLAHGNQGLELLHKSLNALYALVTAVEVMRQKTWLVQYGQCQLMLAQLWMHRRKLREARSVVVNLQMFLRNPSFSQISPDVKGVLTQLWFACKEYLITIADRQARFDDAVQLATQSAKETATQFNGYWLRTFLLQRAKVQLKLGHLEEVIGDCKACIQQHEQHHILDAAYVRAHVLLATAMLFFTSNKKLSSGVEEVLGILRDAQKQAERLALLSGAFPNDANVTFGRAEGVVSRYHQISPLTHNLSSLHVNDPPLTLKASFDYKRLEKYMGIKLKAGKPVNAEDKPEEASPLHGLRLGPIDLNETTYASSEFVNLYLPEHKYLLACNVALCSYLEDVRNSGVCSSEPEDRHEEFHAEKLLFEQVLLGEATLKVLRHSIYVPSQLRVSALTSVGKTRIATARFYNFANPSDLINNVVLPLRTGLEIAHQAAHSWDLMRMLCVQLVEVYGDQELDFGDDENPLRMKKAVIYLVAAIKIFNEKQLLVRNTTSLSNDPAFSATPAEELLSILNNCTASSMTPPLAPKVPPKPVAAPGGKDKKAAPPAKGAPPPATVAQTGRDALFLFASMLRELDDSWKLGEEQELVTDMHQLLKKGYAAYGAKCHLEKLPDPKQPVTVPLSSVSVLFSPMSTPKEFASVVEQAPNELNYQRSGLYSHAAVYFLLGDASKGPAAAAAAPAKGGKPDPAAPAAGGASSEPVLTKLVVPRVDVTHIEKQLRDVRDQLISALAKKLVNVQLSCYDKYGHILCQFVGLLKYGIINTNVIAGGSNSKLSAENAKLLYVAAEEPAGSGVYKVTVTTLETSKKVTMAATEQVMLNLANVVCMDYATDMMVDNDVCRLVRFSLGYDV